MSLLYRHWIGGSVSTLMDKDNISRLFEEISEARMNKVPVELTLSVQRSKEEVKKKNLLLN